MSDTRQSTSSSKDMALMVSQSQALVPTSAGEAKQIGWHSCCSRHGIAIAKCCASQNRNESFVVSGKWMQTVLRWYASNYVKLTDPPLKWFWCFLNQHAVSGATTDLTDISCMAALPKLWKGLLAAAAASILSSYVDGDHREQDNDWKGLGPEPCTSSPYSMALWQHFWDEDRELLRASAFAAVRSNIWGWVKTNTIP